MILEMSSTETIEALSKTNMLLRQLIRANKTKLTATIIARERQRLADDYQKASLENLTVEKAFRKFAMYYGIPSRETIADDHMALQTSNQLFAARYTTANNGLALYEVERLHDILLLAHHSSHAPLTRDEKPSRMLYGTRSSWASEAIWEAALDGFRDRKLLKWLCKKVLPRQETSLLVEIVERIRTKPISAVAPRRNLVLNAVPRIRFGHEYASRILECGLELPHLVSLPGSPCYVVSTNRGWDLIARQVCLEVRASGERWVSTADWTELESQLMKEGSNPFLKAALLESINVW